ncbi:DUF2937 family protein [Rhizobium sp. TRM95111]|uniref:DUF2937 family protein n=1 Tax=Rhizobium alarense TaxID=2846851 RepID=UPI001F19DDF3|nr:DUF2937 family protein [Rhizobium alarense]MCF3642787.1 DUF2937 family protein [Rhizobium alarense]
MTFSQAPEFAQQYQQRLDGALDELAIIVADFDRDATRAGLDRSAALALYDASAEPFLRERGQSVRRTVTRFETISRQAGGLTRASAFTKPLLVLRDADELIHTHAWRDFRPAVPVTAAGVAWAGAGALTAATLSGGLAGLFRSRRRRAIPTSQIP